MPSLLTLRSPISPDASPWDLDAVPHAYEEAGRVQFFAMPGIKWVRDKKSPNGSGYYRGPREALEVVTATLEHAGVLRIQRAHIWCEPKRGLSIGQPNLQLREYQTQGVAWLLDMLTLDGAALLADEMGLGKTPQTIAALDALGDGLVTVICPACVIPHWRAQIKKWSSRPLDLWSLTSYGRLRNDAKNALLPASPRFAVLDEIHYASEPKSQRSKAVAAWLDGCPERPRVAGLTGTPLNTSPYDLWHPLHLLHPGRWGRFYDFQRRYCNGRQIDVEDSRGNPVVRPNGETLSVWKADGASRLDELAQRLRAVMLRRTKAEVASELPARTRIVHEVDIEPGKRKAGARVAMGQNLDEVLRSIEPAKVEAAVELASDIITSGGKLLIGTLLRATAHELAAALVDYGAVCVTGEHDPEQRTAMLANARVGICTIDSMTTGVDLVQFNTMLLVGLPWDPQRLLQFEARIHRIGQTDPCSFYYLVALGTVDERVRERVLERLETFEALLGSGGDASELTGALGGNVEDILAQLAADIIGGST